MKKFWKTLYIFFRSSGFGFQKCFSRNFQFHRRDPNWFDKITSIKPKKWNSRYHWPSRKTCQFRVWQKSRRYNEITFDIPNHILYDCLCQRSSGCLFLGKVKIWIGGISISNRDVVGKMGQGKVCSGLEPPFSHSTVFFGNCQQGQYCSIKYWVLYYLTHCFTFAFQ